MAKGKADSEAAKRTSSVAPRLPAGRHGLPREFVVQNQRERIMTALVDTVAERGYNATTVAHITRAASVSRRTFYEHFADKEACFLAAYEMVAGRGFAALDTETLCRRATVSRAHFDRCFADLEDCFLTLHGEALDQLCGRIEAACEGRNTWHDRIWAAGVATMRHLQEDHTRARFLLVAPNGAGPGAVSRRDRIVQRIADILDGGRDEVEGGRPVSRCTAEIAAGAVYSTIVAKTEAGSIESGEEFLPELVYLATMPYLGSEAAEDELAVQPLR